MPGPVSYDVRVKLVDINHVHARIKDRYIDFFMKTMNKPLDEDIRWSENDALKIHSRALIEKK